MVKKTLSSLKTLLTKEQGEIMSAATVLMLISLVTKVTGMVFLSLTAKVFGTSKETDLFYFASVIPETITNIILLGAISGSIIPIFIKLRHNESEEKFIKSFSSTLNSGMLLFVILSVIAAIFARQLFPLVFQVLQTNSTLTFEQTEQAVWMMRILLIPQIILGLSAFFTTWLNIHERFIIPQLAPLFFNLGKIIGVLVIVPLLGGSIWGLVWGTIIGSVLHLLIQIPLISHLKFDLKLLYVDLKDKYFREVLKLGLPRILSLSVEQLAVVTDSIIAFGLTAGSLTAYQLAVRLISFPLSLFGTSYAIASFPALAKTHAKGNADDFSDLFYKILNQVIFLTIPLTVIFLVMRVPIVRLVYGLLGGNFTWTDTLQVAWIVMFFSIGVTFESLRSIVFRAYYAVHDSVTPMISSLFVVVGGIITGILFTNYFSHFDTFSVLDLRFDYTYFFSKEMGLAAVGGLAVSSSLVFTIEFFLMLLLLRRKGSITNLGRFIKTLWPKFLATIVMMVTSYIMVKMWENVLDTAKVVPLVVLTGSTIFASAMVYLWASYVVGVKEVDVFADFLVKYYHRIVAFIRNARSKILPTR